jgi:hypothetical protein
MRGGEMLGMETSKEGRPMDISDVQHIGRDRI